MSKKKKLNPPKSSSVFEKPSLLNSQQPQGKSKRGIWFDWPAILLTAWLTSRLLWYCEPQGLPADYLWGVVGLAGAIAWFGYQLLGCTSKEVNDNRMYTTNTAIRMTKTDIMIAAFLILYVGCSLASFSDGNQRAIINCCWSALFWGLSYAMVRQIITTRDRMNILLSGFLVMTFVLAVWAIYQYTIEYPQLKAEYVANPEQTLRDSGLWFTKDSSAGQMFEDRFFSFEPTASFSLTNSLAVFLIPWTLVWLTGMIPHVFSGCCVNTGENKNMMKKSIMPLLLCIVWLIPVLYALLLTHSRAAILALMSVSAVYGMSVVISCYSSWKFRLTVVICPILIGIIMISGIMWLKPAIWDSLMLTIDYRLQYWQATCSMISDYPWLGVGAGDFQEYYTAYMLSESGESISDPHNFLLEIAALVGAPLALLFWGIVGYISWRLISVFKPLTITGLEDSRDNTGEYGQNYIGEQSPDCISEHGQSYIGEQSPDAIDKQEQNNIVNTGSINDMSLYELMSNVLVSAFLAILAGFVMGLIVAGQNPGPIHVLLISAVIGLFLLRPGMPQKPIQNSIKQNSIKSYATQVGLALLGLFLALMVSGGFGFTSISLSIWTLLAIAVTLVETPSLSGANPERQPVGSPDSRFGVTDRAICIASIIIVLFLLLMCTMTGYYPTIQSDLARRLAYYSKTAAEQEQFAAEAVEVDPFDCWTHASLANIYLQRWRETGDEHDYYKYIDCYQEALSRNPRNCMLWRDYGQGCWSHFEKTKQQESAEEAFRVFKESERLFPVDINGRAWRSLAQYHCVKFESQRELLCTEMQQLLEESDQTPHKNRKIRPDIQTRIEALGE